MNTAIQLKPNELAFADAIAAAVQASQKELHPYLIWATPDYSSEMAREWLERQIQERDAGTAFGFNIFQPNGKLLGGCGINRLDHENRTANLGYWVRSDLTGRGIATSAARRVCEWAFANTDLHRLEILCSTANVRSKRVAEKLGAHYEGIYRGRLRLHGKQHDVHVFSILRGHEWP